MPDAYALYVVTAVVVAALVLWVAWVHKTAKEPWARARTSAAPGAPQSPGGVDADATAKATPLALASDGTTRPATAAADEKASPDVDA